FTGPETAGRAVASAIDTRVVRACVSGNVRGTPFAGDDGEEVSRRRARRTPRGHPDPVAAPGAGWSGPRRSPATDPDRSRRPAAPTAVPTVRARGPANPRDRGSPCPRAPHHPARTVVAPPTGASPPRARAARRPAASVEGWWPGPRQRCSAGP